MIHVCKYVIVPKNLSSVLQEYTEQGYRVIALGYRVLDEVDYVQVQKMNRNEIEKDFEFGGLIVLENRLKPQTKGVINVLKSARIKVVMVTGKNFNYFLNSYLLILTVILTNNWNSI